LSKKIRASGDDVFHEVRGLLDLHKNTSAKHIVIEGLMGAGKTCLAKALTNKEVSVIHLDDFVQGEMSDDDRWMQSVIAGGALDKISERLARSRKVIVDGAAAIPILKQLSEFQEENWVKIYIKLMSVSGGVATWLEGDLLEDKSLPESPQLCDIRDYHLQERPWETACIIVERIPTNGKQA